MAIVNMSVDTVTRQATVAVDGVMVPAVACFLEKFVDMDGETHVFLSYEIAVEGGNGLMERRMVFLPRKDDVDAVIAEDTGLAEKQVVDPDIREAVAKYMKGE